MRRILVAAVMGLMMTATSTFAADEQATVSLTPALSVAATAIAQRTDLGATLNAAPKYVAPRRPSLLPTLYAGSALLQGFDAYSTLSAIKAGAVEANPLMKSVVKSPAAFVAVKAGIATASILAAERLWKDNRRVAAIATMVITNSAMAMVAAHNASVMRRLR